MGKHHWLGCGFFSLTQVSYQIFYIIGCCCMGPRSQSATRFHASLSSCWGQSCRRPTNQNGCICRSSELSEFQCQGRCQRIRCWLRGLLSQSHTWRIVWLPSTFPCFCSQAANGLLWSRRPRYIVTAHHAQFGRINPLGWSILSIGRASLFDYTYFAYVTSDRRRCVYIRWSLYAIYCYYFVREFIVVSR